ncbi:uncharacterized protein LAESUDRAFT_538011 [Laetiporus sulphureus 93-53]|uniref:Uncharacterized protein n=1 Tax=Laetiporus sulphureus 93-53 TaxID=1314785 RepID=A0A165FKD5_9APHY|nr:uncharacterized protein LAESUDRAFT_538011 [Laetiporus sulphureus 93-53]KZT09105.1 hypothetical protein LAESUDRAFT_538011 [Laetiporus sulphureus 93-53]
MLSNAIYCTCPEDASFTVVHRKPYLRRISISLPKQSSHSPKTVISVHTHPQPAQRIPTSQAHIASHISQVSYVEIRYDPGRPAPHPPSRVSTGTRASMHCQRLAATAIPLVRPQRAAPRARNRRAARTLSSYPNPVNRKPCIIPLCCNSVPSSPSLARSLRLILLYV